MKQCKGITIAEDHSLARDSSTTELNKSSCLRRELWQEMQCVSVNFLQITETKFAMTINYLIQSVDGFI